MSKECRETITIQVPNIFPSDSLVSVVGSDGLTYAVRLPKDAVPGSKITVLIPTRESVDSTNKSMQSNYTPSQITMGAAAAAGSEMLKLFYLFKRMKVFISTLRLILRDYWYSDSRPSCWRISSWRCSVCYHQRR